MSLHPGPGLHPRSRFASGAGFAPHHGFAPGAGFATGAGFAPGDGSAPGDGFAPGAGFVPGLATDSPPALRLHPGVRLHPGWRAPGGMQGDRRAPGSAGTRRAAPSRCQLPAAGCPVCPVSRTGQALWSRPHLAALPWELSKAPSSWCRAGTEQGSGSVATPPNPWPCRKSRPKAPGESPVLQGPAQCLPGGWTLSPWGVPGGHSVVPPPADTLAGCALRPPSPCWLCVLGTLVLSPFLLLAVPGGCPSPRSEGPGQHPIAFIPPLPPLPPSPAP